MSQLSLPHGGVFRGFAASCAASVAALWPCLVAVVLAAAACTQTEPTNYDVLPRPPPEGWAQLRILHVMADTPSLDVYLRDTTDPVFTSLGHGFAQGFIEVAARTYSIDLRLGPASPNSEVMSSFDVTLASRERVTVVLAGTGEALTHVRFAVR